MIITILLLLIAYALGSISSAILLCQYLKLPDPREEGSKNAGATNVMRFADKKTAIYVLIGDIAKGLLAVLLGKLLGVNGIALGFIGFAAVLGHVYPLYFQFKGGKGVATALGVLLGLSPILALITGVVWIAVAALYRYSSLASTTAAIVAPISALLLKPEYFPALVLIAVLLFYKHKDNIRRLREGTEPKIGEKS